MEPEVMRQIVSSLLLMALMAQCCWLPLATAPPIRTRQPRAGNHRPSESTSGRGGTSPGTATNDHEHPHRQPSHHDAGTHHHVRVPEPPPASPQHPPRQQTPEMVPVHSAGNRPAEASWGHATTHLTAPVREEEESRPEILQLPKKEKHHRHHGPDLPVMQKEKKDPEATPSPLSDKNVLRDYCENLRRRGGALAVMSKPIIIAGTDCRKFLVCLPGEPGAYRVWGCAEGQRAAFYGTNVRPACLLAEHVDCFDDHSRLKH